VNKPNATMKILFDLLHRFLEHPIEEGPDYTIVVADAKNVLIQNAVLPAFPWVEFLV
jgi:hypothetical protein